MDPIVTIVTIVAIGIIETVDANSNGKNHSYYGYNRDYRCSSIDRNDRNYSNNRYYRRILWMGRFNDGRMRGWEDAMIGRKRGCKRGD